MFKCTDHSKPRFSRDLISTGVTEIDAGSFYLLVRYKIIQWNFMSFLANGSLRLWVYQKYPVPSMRLKLPGYPW